MILGFMQPYFFPYLGYFDLINRCDVWYVFDVVKYQDRQWLNRNRVMHPRFGWQYVTVPARHQSEAAIKDVLIHDAREARRKILAQLEHYRTRRAPFFEETMALVASCFDTTESDWLRDLAVSSLTVSCRYLGIPFQPNIFSRSGIQLPPIEHRGQWAVALSAAVGATDYLNAPGAQTMDIFQPEEFARLNIRLHFLEPNNFTYACGGSDFIPDLSIIDVLMWNAPGAVKTHLDAAKARWLAATGAHSTRNCVTATARVLGP